MARTYELERPLKSRPPFVNTAVKEFVRDAEGKPSSH